MTMVGHKTESIYRRYAIVDEAMLREAADRLAAAQGSGWAKSWAKWPGERIATVGKEAENLAGSTGLEPATSGLTGESCPDIGSECK
jgi:hypothetical protein